MLLALFTGNSLADLAIGIVIAIAVIALVCLYLRVSKIPVPDWFWDVLWIVVAAVVIILAIRFVASL